MVVDVAVIGSGFGGLGAAIRLILEDRREDGLRGIPPEAIQETVTVQ